MLWNCTEAVLRELLPEVLGEFLKRNPGACMCPRCTEDALAEARKGKGALVSYLPLKKLDVVVEFGGLTGDCLALSRLSVGPGGRAELVLTPACFVRFAVEANLGEASGRPGTWEDAAGKPLAVSVLVHAGGRVLALKRREHLAVQSGLWTASVTGTAVPADAAGPDPLAAAALRELREEVDLAAGDGELSFRGLALAPGKAQAVALFEFAASLPPEGLLARALSWSRFGEEHAGAEVLPPERALELPLSPVSRLAVGLLLGAPPPPGHYRLAEREREALRRLASLDPLTGLLNGR
ncbi:NUDIX domain-containing protein, partial [Desulfovirgula thermocuniculi]|uniref:NUDIX domain-containing protein n=1 Tax=Desulfovirgula thermocuniculi TaxID=348842 RepID=UPI0005558B65